MKKNLIKKTLHNSNVSQAKDNVRDLKVFGNGDLFKLISKASSESEGWMKSTKAMEIEGVGCVIQVTTQQMNPDGSYAIAEALTFVPNTRILNKGNGTREIVYDSVFVKGGTVGSLNGEIFCEKELKKAMRGKRR